MLSGLPQEDPPMTALGEPGVARDPAWHGIDPLDPDPSRRDDPFPSLHHLRQVAPVNLTPLGFWRLARYADCVRLLREVPCGVRRRDGSLPRMPDAAGEFMLQQDPPTHTRLRKLVSKAFTPRAVERWRTRAQAVADECLERALGADAGDLDVIEALALPLPSTLICEMLGVPVEDRARFTGWTADATHALAGSLAPPEVQARAGSAALALAGYFEGLIAERRRRPGDDLLDVLIRAEEDGDRLSPIELLVQSIGLLIAGFETTVGLIGNGAAALARHPGELAKLRTDASLVPNAVEECLRYEGPIGATIRVLHADAEFGGRVIPADTEVWALLWSANRDPERFPDPDRFDVERPDARDHLGFGGGTHFCLGAHLARMEAQVALGTLVERTRELALAEEPVAWGPSLFRVPARLRVSYARSRDGGRSRAQRSVG
jgi:cytochrome P450